MVGTWIYALFGNSVVLAYISRAYAKYKFWTYTGGSWIHNYRFLLNGNIESPTDCLTSRLASPVYRVSVVTRPGYRVVRLVSGLAMYLFPNTCSQAPGLWTAGSNVLIGPEVLVPLTRPRSLAAALVKWANIIMQKTRVTIPARLNTSAPQQHRTQRYIENLTPGWKASWHDKGTNFTMIFGPNSIFGTPTDWFLYMTRKEYVHNSSTYRILHYQILL
jgi:hypothetical protein